jgi:hypothetical protein
MIRAEFGKSFLFAHFVCGLARLESPNKIFDKRTDIYHVGFLVIFVTHNEEEK